MEIWKTISDNSLYEVSNYGGIKRKSYYRWCKPNNSFSFIKEHFIKPTKNKKGYLRVSLSKNNTKKNYSVHRLVADCFITNPRKLPQVNHIDGNKLNNSVDNLEWCSNIENMRHRIETLKIVTIGKGEKGLNSKLKEFQVLQIPILLEKGLSNKNIAKLFNLKSPSTIDFIRKGITWSHLNLFNKNIGKD